MVLVSLLIFLNQCVDCSQYSSYGWLIFIAIEILPMTVIVLLILIFNIQLTNGSINGLVFFYQISSIVYPGLTDNVILIPHYYSLLSWIIFYSHPFVSFFNLDFTSLYHDYNLVIVSWLSTLHYI